MPLLQKKIQLLNKKKQSLRRAMTLPEVKQYIDIIYGVN